jgi:hypothetical protein
VAGKSFHAISLLAVAQSAASGSIEVKASSEALGLDFSE